eukprot:941232-Pelagomonas_calceolata.AAC.1
MPPKGLGARKGAATPCVYALRIRPAPRWQLPALTPMARQPRITEQRCQFPERKDYKHENACGRSTNLANGVKRAPPPSGPVTPADIS